MRRFLMLALVILATPLAAQERVPTAADSARARLASVRSDLRNLVVAQEAYFLDNNRYAKTMEELGVSYRASAGTHIRLVYVEANAWTGEAKREGLVGSCTIWIGEGIPAERRAKTLEAGLVGEDGAPTCDPQPALTPSPPVASSRPPLN